MTGNMIAAELCGLLLFLCSTARAHPEEYAFKAQWGRRGSAPGQFIKPVSLAVSADGHVYVVDQGNARIQKFTSDGAFVKAWGERDINPHVLSYGAKGDTSGKLCVPHGIAVAPAGTVLVAEWGNHRVQRFSPDGRFLAKWGGQGTEEGLLSFPLGVAADRAGNVYVADHDNGRVTVFAGDGNYLRTVKRYGCRPYDLAVDPAGNICIADIRGQFWKFNPAGELVGWAGFGRRVEAPDVTRSGWFGADIAFSTETGKGFWAEPGDAPGQFCEPRGIGVDDAGNIFVADSRNHRIQKFSPQGELLAIWGRKGKGHGEFNWPYDVAVGADASVFVVDKYNHRVQKFVPVRK